MFWKKPWYTYLGERNKAPSDPCKVCYHSKTEHYKRLDGIKRLACALCISEGDPGCANGKPKKKKKKQKAPG